MFVEILLSGSYELVRSLSGSFNHLWNNSLYTMTSSSYH